MKLVTVELKAEAAHVDAALQTLADQAALVREMPGCAQYTLYRHPGQPGIAILQKWHSMTAFDSYRASDVFAHLGHALAPMMAGPPVTTIAEVDAP